jgi:hypothetical protein
VPASEITTWLSIQRLLGAAAHLLAAQPQHRLDAVRRCADAQEPQHGGEVDVHDGVLATEAGEHRTGLGADEEGLDAGGDVAQHQAEQGVPDEPGEQGGTLQPPGQPERAA